MPLGTGYVGDEIHDKLIRDAEEFNTWSEGQLQTPFDAMNRYWKLWFAQRKEWRKQHEMWRANFAIPYPFTVVESNVAVLCDILMSSDPPIQAEGVERVDDGPAKAIEQHLDYILRRNRWGRTIELLMRSAAIQGITVPKLTWVNRSVMVNFMARDSDVNDWKQRVKEAELAVQYPAPDNPDEYEAWQEAVEAQTEGKMRVPSIPLSGKQEVLDYAGPWINRIPIWHLRYDPLIEDIEDHEVIIQRSVKSMDWIKDRTGPGKPYDEGQVEQAFNGWDGTRLETWEQEQAEMMGVTAGSITDNPQYRKSGELWEVWKPRSEFPFQVILNRKAIINRDPTNSPYWHGQVPYIPIRNLGIPGHFHGMSELQQSEKLFKEADLLRNLRADAILLQVLPVFAKMKEIGLSELQKRIVPGMILDLARADGIQQVMKPNPGIADAFREIPDIKNDIDDATSAYPQLRGAPSTVGRVSATESERRFSQAQVRQKQRAVRVEEELQRMVKQMLFLSYQFYSPEKRKRIGGHDVLPTIPRETFLEGLEMDFRFRGATKALNRDMMAQQLVTFVQQFGNYLAPTEARECMRRYLEITGVKGIDQIILPQQTQNMQMMADAQMQMQLAPPQPEPPSEVSGDLADQMVREADANAQPLPPEGGNGAPPVDEGAAGTPFQPA